jgi:hypothetical protein
LPRDAIHDPATELRAIEDQQALPRLVRRFR